MLVTMEITLNYFSSFGSHSGNFFPLSRLFLVFLKQCLLSFQAVVMMKDSAKRIHRYIDLPTLVGIQIVGHF